jgi:hypothetical protein
LCDLLFERYVDLTSGWRLADFIDGELAAALAAAKHHGKAVPT